MKIDLNAFHTSLVGVAPLPKKKLTPELFYTKEAVDTRRIESHIKDLVDLISYLKSELKGMGKEETVLSVQTEYAIEDAQELLNRLKKIEAEID